MYYEKKSTLKKVLVFFPSSLTSYSSFSLVWLFRVLSNFTGWSSCENGRWYQVVRENVPAIKVGHCLLANMLSCWQTKQWLKFGVFV